MPHIVFICTANICRSPVGEALLRDRLQKQGLGHWQVSSAGTWASNRHPAAPYSQEVLLQNEGIALQNHRSRVVDEMIMQEGHLFLCMETGHAEALRIEFPHKAKQIFLLSQMVNNARYNIADPYGGPRDGYVQMVEQVKGLIENGLPRIMELAQAGLPPH